MDIIKTYITKCLRPRIMSFNLNPNIIKKVTTDIENRLSSIFSRWNDLGFRQTLLLTGVEEAAFYVPSASLEKKALVVLAIRNSLIEDISSTKEAANKLGLIGPVIDDNEIRILTQEAIEFFSQVDLAQMSSQLHIENNDPYQAIPNEYPVAWNAMSYLGSLTKQYIQFTPLVMSQLDFKTVEYFGNPDKKRSSQVLSGMDPTFDSNLLEVLSKVVNGTVSIFFVDSFKMLTRHPEKLFKAMEVILRANAALVSFNYYISNGYVCRRKQLLRPAHSSKEIDDKFNDLNGLRRTHLEALNVVNE